MIEIVVINFLISQIINFWFGDNDDNEDNENNGDDDDDDAVTSQDRVSGVSFESAKVRMSDWSRASIEA